MPFCCDTRHMVPTAYQKEWEYLQGSTDLWHLWASDDLSLDAQLRQQTPEGMVLVECLGHRLCQRNYRTITCRAFPFFPYITRQGDFIGLAAYWEFEDSCWVISNLQVVTSEYRAQFISTFEYLFDQAPQEQENYQYFSSLMRRVFGRRHRAICLLHRNGQYYKVTPRNGRMRLIKPSQLPSFGPYRLAAELPFPDEINR
ncbi:MAG: hypothetical protein JXB15_17505 [Anaerolineales bacterium]|nr:hypothetical protein [Anaerolineales bacterium]